MSGYGESRGGIFLRRYFRERRKIAEGRECVRVGVFVLNRSGSMSQDIEETSISSPSEHIVEVKKIIIAGVVLLKTRRRTSRMESDVILSIRRTYPFG